MALQILLRLTTTMLDEVKPWHRPQNDHLYGKRWFSSSVAEDYGKAVALHTQKRWRAQLQLTKAATQNATFWY